VSAVKEKSDMAKLACPALNTRISAIRYPCGMRSGAEVGEERQISIVEFLEDVTHIRDVKSTDDKGAREYAKVSKLPLWYFGTLNGGPGSSRKAGMHTGSCLVFDLDGDGTEQKEKDISASLKRLEKWGRACAIQTTINHGVEGKGSRYRVLIPVVTPYLAVHHFAIREALGYRLFGRSLKKGDATNEVVDFRTEDPVRSYFQGGHWADMPAPVTVYNSGDAINPINYICRRTYEGAYFFHLALDLKKLGVDVEDAVGHMQKENSIINARNETHQHDNEDLESIVEKVFKMESPEFDEHSLRDIFQSLRDNKRKKNGRAPKSIVELRNLLSYYNPRYEVSEDKSYITRYGKELPLSDNLLEDLRIDCEITLGHVYTAKDILNQMRAEAALRRFDKVIDYLHSLPQWDGTERWKQLVKYKEKEGFDFIMSKFMERWAIATVRTRFQPDYPVQEVPLLIGGVGKSKSFMLQALCPNKEWFTDAVKHFERNPQNSATLEGKWIVLFDEIDRFATKAGNGELKDGVTKVDHTTQKKYSLFQDDFKKRFTYLASCNPHRLWRDPEGQRRFLPMEVVSVWSMEKVIENRNQLWAEAFAKHLRGDRTWYPDEERDAIVELNKDYYAVTDTIVKLGENLDKIQVGISEHKDIKAILWPHRDRLTNAENNEMDEALRYYGFRLQRMSKANRFVVTTA
jgi:predicted P-loop ATPase